MPSWPTTTGDWPKLAKRPSRQGANGKPARRGNRPRRPTARERLRQAGQPFCPARPAIESGRPPKLPRLPTARDALPKIANRSGKPWPRLPTAIEILPKIANRDGLVGEGGQLGR